MLPLIVIATLIVAPLAIWAATSAGGGGDGDEGPLLVERGVGVSGEPELILSVTDEEVTVSGGKTSVRVECFDARGDAIVRGTQPWPFITEPGYPYPHAHQVVPADKIDLARRCRVLGTSKRLEAEVQ
jgi:hypothetical protein